MQTTQLDAARVYRNATEMIHDLTGDGPHMATLVRIRYTSRVWKVLLIILAINTGGVILSKLGDEVLGLIFESVLTTLGMLLVALGSAIYLIYKFSKPDADIAVLTADKLLLVVNIKRSVHGVSAGKLVTVTRAEIVRTKLREWPLLPSLHIWLKDKTRIILLQHRIWNRHFMLGEDAVSLKEFSRNVTSFEAPDKSRQLDHYAIDEVRLMGWVQFTTGILLYTVSWFLTAAFVNGEYVYRGYDAFWAAMRAIFGEHQHMNVHDWIVQLLYLISGATNFLFVVLAVSIVADKKGTVSHWAPSYLCAAMWLNLFWFIYPGAPDREELKPGYYLWVVSFLITASGSFLLLKTNHRIHPAGYNYFYKLLPWMISTGLLFLLGILRIHNQLPLFASRSKGTSGKKQQVNMVSLL